jgi:hypothetical protein
MIYEGKLLPAKRKKDLARMLIDVFGLRKSMETQNFYVRYDCRGKFLDTSELVGDDQEVQKRLCEKYEVGDESGDDDYRVYTPRNTYAIMKVCFIAADAIYLGKWERLFHGFPEEGPTGLLKEWVQHRLPWGEGNTCTEEEREAWNRHWHNCFFHVALRFGMGVPYEPNCVGEEQAIAVALALLKRDGGDNYGYIYNEDEAGDYSSNEHTTALGQYSRQDSNFDGILDHIMDNAVGESFAEWSWFTPFDDDAVDKDIKLLDERWTVQTTSTTFTQWRDWPDVTSAMVNEDRKHEVIVHTHDGKEDSTTGTAAKRKAPSSGGVTKKLKVESGNSDWHALLKMDHIKKQTVPTLKIFCKEKGLPCSGKKADLVKRVEQAIKELKDRSSNLDWYGLLKADQIKKQTVLTLKSFCKEKGLPCSGKKADLVKRIEATLGS